MLQWVRCKEKDNLILFIHGLKGGGETWAYDKDITFPLLIKKEKSLKYTYDIACFNYFTTFTDTYAKTKSWTQKIFGSSNKIKKNLPIDEISELLLTETKVNLSHYKNIILIAHSMGGLVSKSCILKQLNSNSPKNITGFISLAVPHSGAKLANIGGLLSSNIQLEDLSVLSNSIDSLTRLWIQAENKPTTKYIYAANDQIVDKKSALAIDSTKDDSMAVDEDHSSICKPKNRKQTIYRAVINYINEVEEKLKKKSKL